MVSQLSRMSEADYVHELLSELGSWLFEALPADSYQLVDEACAEPDCDRVVRLRPARAGSARVDFFCSRNRWAVMGFGVDGSLELDLSRPADRDFALAVVAAVVRGRVIEQLVRRNGVLLRSTATTMPDRHVATDMLGGLSAEGTIVSGNHYGHVSDGDEVEIVEHLPYV